MARHRAAGARTTAPTSPSPTPAPAAGPDLGGLLPRQGRGEEHPSGPLPRLVRGARRAPSPGVPGSRGIADRAGRADPPTAPLDLAAIALAAAGARRAGLPAAGTSPAGATATTAVARTVADDPATGGTPRPAYPAAVPSALAPPTPAHPVPAVGRGRPGHRVPLPTRTAGALALVGALAGGGVAVVGGGTMLAADPAPDTGELGVAGTGAAAATVAPGASSPASSGRAEDSPDRSGGRDRDQGGRHRADRSDSTAARGSR